VSKEPCDGTSEPSAVTQPCCGNSRDIAGGPINRLQQMLQLHDQQRAAALEDLANASAEAAQIIKAACPTDISLTAPGRSEVKQDRLEATAQDVADRATFTGGIVSSVE
jgi:hypothetical protein